AIGYYAPFMILAAVISSVGAGLTTTFATDTGREKWIGYQIMYGFGVGLGIQQPIIAAQTVLPIQDVPTGASLMLFFQLLGGAIFLSVGQNIFTNSLVSGVANVPNVTS